MFWRSQVKLDVQQVLYDKLPDTDRALLDEIAAEIADCIPTPEVKIVFRETD